MVGLWKVRGVKNTPYTARQKYGIIYDCCWGARLVAKVPRCLAEIIPIGPDPGYAGVGNNCDLRPESLEKKIKDIKKVETKR